MGYAQLSVKPAGATVVYSRASESERVVPDLNKAVPLSPGEYTFSASATGYDKETQPVIIQAGETSPVSFNLSKTIVIRPTQ